MGSEMAESQRALELRKYFAPFDPNVVVDLKGFDAGVPDDGALYAFAESVLWRLKGRRVMVSLVDKNTQYFVAGVSRDDEGNIEPAAIWFGSSTCPTEGGLCENTLAIRTNTDQYPCFEVKDLTKDSRFATLSVVDGSLESYRFYAGTPIVTRNGTNIGSFFLFDRVARPDGLTFQERKWFSESASYAMRHLETKREAAERSRAAMMSKGIAQFLELTSSETEEYENELDTDMPTSRSNSPIYGNPISKKKEADAQSTSSKILDKIELTLDHAATILRESLDIEKGGVVFLDTALGIHESPGASDYFGVSIDHAGDSETSVDGSSDPSAYGQYGSPLPVSAGSVARGANSPGHIRSAHDGQRPAKVLALSEIAWAPGSIPVDAKTLKSFASSYPKGNVWYIDENGYFSSIEQSHLHQMSEMSNHSSPSERRRPTSWRFDLKRQKTEADMLSKIFVKARQIIFLPLWDVVGKRWYAGCFVWSLSAVPVFTVESEISYLSAFTNSVMVEISRLDAITANKMKSNFMSSISHEFRSPLHGILASSDFLRETPLDSNQTEFISTIQSCGSTLLDTINHVLDYSRINVFEKKYGSNAEVAHGLHEPCNVALLCEEIISGMIAAKDYKGVGIDLPMNMHSSSHAADGSVGETGDVEIILDFEHRNWNYKIQPGALRRIVMNLFGNAYKFTTHGFIHVRLRVRSPGSRAQALVLNIMDSGIGISQEYMAQKLYTPFAQEDSFATGVGLGLSIVWSIVKQLGGKIFVRSERAKGTDVEVVLPLGGVEELSGEKTQRSHMAIRWAEEAEICIERLNERAGKLGVAIWKAKPSSTEEETTSQRLAVQKLSEHCVEGYLRDWFGFELIPFSSPEASSKADILLQPYDKYDLSTPPKNPNQCVLLLQDLLNSTKAITKHTGTQKPLPLPPSPYLHTIYRPLGPYKLATALAKLLDSAEKAKLAANDASTVEQRRESRESTTTIRANPLSQSQNSHPLSRENSSTLPLRPSSSSSPEKTKESSDASISTPNPNIDSQSTPVPTRTAVSTSASHVLPPLTILVVDDNELNLTLLHRYLLKRNPVSKPAAAPVASQDTATVPGVEVGSQPSSVLQTGRNRGDRIVLARDGVEAVEAFENEFVGAAMGGEGVCEENSQKGFDVIFMDISMPRMDGFEAVRRIRGFENLSMRRNSTFALPPPPTGTNTKFLDVDSTEAIASEGNETAETTPDVEIEQKEAESRMERARKAGGERQKRAYIVALTGLGSKRDRDEAEECGVDEFLTKPVGFVRVGDVLGRVASKRGEMVN